MFFQALLLTQSAIVYLNVNKVNFLSRSFSLRKELWRLTMPDNQSYGLVPSHQLTSAAVPGSPPVSAGHRTGKGGAYDGLPTDDAGDKDSTTYPSAAFSSPALPTTGGLDSPSTPFKSMEEVKRFDELKKKDTVRFPPWELSRVYVVIAGIVCCFIPLSTFTAVS